MLDKKTLDGMDSQEDMSQLMLFAKEQKENLEQ